MLGDNCAGAPTPLLVEAPQGSVESLHPGT